MTQSSLTRSIASLGSGRGPLLLTAAALLAASAAVIQYRVRKVEREHPPTGSFVEVDGVRLHYVERGEGQPVVLLHGNGTTSQDFDLSGVLDAAAQRYRVIAFDRPGYGYSQRPRGRSFSPEAQAELFARAFRKLGIDAPIVVAHSWGTLVALTLALEHRDSVRSLVLLSGYYYPSARLDVPLMVGPAIPVLGDLMRYTISPWFGRLIWRGMVKRLFGPAEVPQRFEAFPTWMALRPSQLRASAAEGALMIPAALALRHRYAELELPVVVMAGAKDKHVNTAFHSEHLHHDVAQSELVLQPEAGHMVHYSAPEEVVAAIDTAASVDAPTAFVPQVAQAA